MRRSEQTERCIVGIWQPGKADADDLRTKSSLGLPSRSRSVDCLRVQLSQCETRAAALALLPPDLSVNTLFPCTSNKITRSGFLSKGKKDK